MTRGRVDRSVANRHLAALREAVEHLRRHRGRPASELTTDLDHRWAVERGLQLCVQHALDVSGHIVAAAGQDPTSYASIIDALGRLGAVPAEFAAEFRGIAGFRNALVHAYMELDLSRVHSVLNDYLDEFEAFAEHVEGWLAADDTA